MGKRSSAALIMLPAALLFLFGCLGSSLPSACASVPSAQLPSCVYNNAVMEQNPNYCYSMSDIEQRKICIRDAADPAMRKALQHSLSSGNEAVFFEQPATGAGAATQGASQPPVQHDLCSGLSGNDRDSCIATSAISARNITACVPVANSDIRKGCISDIARKTKDIASCGTLPNDDDNKLCKLYAKGDESRG